MGIGGIIRDITQRKQEEEALRQSQERFKELAELLPETIYEMDARGNFTFVNRNAFTLFRYTQQDFDRGLNAFDMIVPHERRRAMANVKRILKGEEIGLTEYTALRKDGSTFPCMIRSTPIIREGNPVGLRGIVIDITARKRGEKRLVESEARYRELADSIADVFFAMDKELRYTFWNRASEELTGILAKDALGKSLYELFPDVKGTRAEKMYLEAIRKLQPQSFTNEYQLGGKDFVFEIRAYPSRHGLSVFVKDVTEHTRAEEALKESEEKFRTLSEHSPNMIFINVNGKVVYANEKCEEVMGYKREELYSPDFSFLTLIAPESLDIVKDRFRRHQKGEEVPPYEYTLITKEGKRIDAMISARLVKYGRETGILGIVTDISERKRAEQALAEKDEQLKHQAQHLEKVNTALEVLLNHREEQKKRLEESILANVKKLIFPRIDQMENSRLDPENKMALSIVKSTLNDLISPLATTLSSKYLDLTPTEIQIADLVKHGKTSKEISSLLHISTNAVSFHRNNIRKKLSLSNQKTNLRSYLQSFSN